MPHLLLGMKSFNVQLIYQRKIKQNIDIILFSLDIDRDD